MEYKRIEVLKIVREAVRIDDVELAKKLFVQLLRHPVLFTIKTSTLGPYSDCSVIAVGDLAVDVMSRKPRARLAAKYCDIELIEVESNVDVLNFPDEEERWDNML